MDIKETKQIRDDWIRELGLYVRKVGKKLIVAEHWNSWIRVAV